MFRIKKIISLFFVVLFASYYAGTAFFSHLHVIGETTISHSHLHTDSHHDTQSGGHTEHCITLIAQISQLYYVDFSCDYLPNTAQYLLHNNKYTEIFQWKISVYLQNTSLRAPPVLA